MFFLRTISTILYLTVRANCQTKKDDLHDFHREARELHKTLTG